MGWIIRVGSTHAARSEAQQETTLTISFLAPQDRGARVEVKVTPNAGRTTFPATSGSASVAEQVWQRVLSTLVGGC
jgi:hypothetical protein